MVGATNVRTDIRTMGGEDFSAMLRQVPGCFIAVGSRNRERGLTWDHHHPRFDVDEASLEIGAEVPRPLRVVLIGTDFEVRVWETLLRIPMGRAVCYSDIANKIKNPKASRAVGASSAPFWAGITDAASFERAMDARLAHAHELVTALLAVTICLLPVLLVLVCVDDVTQPAADAAVHTAVPACP